MQKHYDDLSRGKCGRVARAKALVICMSYAGIFSVESDFFNNLLIISRWAESSG